MKAWIAPAAAALTFALLTGCGSAGTKGLTAAPLLAADTMDAASYNGLKGAFTRIHKAIFTSMDTDRNGWLDEYEAGKHMSLRDFKKADKSSGWGSANRLSRTEFVDWSTRTFLWFHDDAESFAKRFRSDLGSVFKRLDADKDGLLVSNELSTYDLNKLRLSFDYDKLNIHVPIRVISPDAQKAADKTHDGRLSAAEFEDLYLAMVVEALGGDGSAPAPAPAPSNAPAPAPSNAPAPQPALQN